MRAPTTSINILTQRLIHKIRTEKPNDESLVMLRAIFNASHIMSCLMNDLLDNMLLEHGHFKPQLE
jgi:hypothetical protein